ncbi:MAG TPA: rod shape-determining protein RodA [Streptosporangiaceae bacterium]|nr:rod shape-determining protein RodA [Streptosporangiaceae bacterium]
MSSWRGSPDLGSRRSAPPVPGSAAYRDLPPVRLSGGTARRAGFRPGPDFGRDRRGRLRRLLGKIFGAGSPLRRLDWILLVAVLALCAIGTLLVWSATSTNGMSTADPYLSKDILNIGIGLALMAGVSMLDYRQLRQYAPVVLVASCVGLLVVLAPLGHFTAPVNGAKSWITLPGGFQIEPSEYAKLSIIFVSATILAVVPRRERRPRLRAVGIMLGVAAVPLVLVLAEPDLGVVMLMLALIIGMIALSGIRLRWLAALVVVGAAGIAAVIKLHLLKAYQVSRLTSFLNPSADPRGTGYSAEQSKIAIGSGGLTGQGLFHGQLIAGGFVPEQHTDFIFAVAGEELGFVGCLVIIGLLAVVLLCAIRIAARADDQFGMLVAGGIAIWFAVQSFINIGMTIGIMPVTGLPLPFVSYGGSAIFADMIAIGALQTVHRHRSVFD